jgi:hypothetical protein
MEEKTSRDARAAEGSACVGELSGATEAIWPAFAEGFRTLMRMGGQPQPMRRPAPHLGGLVESRMPHLHAI